MRVTIVGAGAVGGLLGAMLSRSGCDVVFLARGATRDRLRGIGVEVTTPDEVFHTGPFQAEDKASLLGASDAVFVAVKGWQLGALAGELGCLLTPDGVIVSLLNGVEAADVLSRVVGPEHVVGGLCHVLASTTAPGRITVRGERLKVTLGELAGGTSQRVDGLAAVLRAAGVAVSVASDVRVALWEKLLFVGPMGMIGAATGLSADAYRALPMSRGLVAEAMAEVRDVALAHGVPMPADAIAAALKRLDSLPRGSTTSMQRDLVAGLPSELDQQVGAVVRLAAAAGMNVPVHRVLHVTLATKEQSRSMQRGTPTPVG